MRSKFAVGVILLFLFIGPVFGATITKSGSAEFDVSGAQFTNTEISGEVVVLESTPEARWTANGVKASTSSGDDDIPFMASDGSGGTIVAWLDKTFARGDIYASRVNSSGTIPSPWPVAVDTANITKDTPQIVKSTDGGTQDGVIIIWERGDNIYARKLSLAGASLWGPTAVCTAAGTQDRPQLASDNQGGAVVVWRDYRDTNSAIYTQWLNESGGLKYPAIIPTNGVTVCAISDGGRTTNTDRPRVVPLRQTANDQGYMIAWEDQRDGYKNIYARRLDDTGFFDIDPDHYGTNGVSVSASSVRKESYKMVESLTYSGAIFVWREGTIPNCDVYAQWVHPDGSRAWGSSGVKLTSVSETVANPRVGALPSVGAVASWIVDAGGGSYANYVQKLDVYGTVQWDAGGRNLGFPLFYDLAYDNAGGVYAAGISGDFSAAYPYAQRIDSSGNELWGGGGLNLSSYPMTLIDDAIKEVVSENPGIIFTWVDSREANKDIYVQKVSDLYWTSGSYTTEKIENPSLYFNKWESISWEALGTLTAEVRTAASESVLNSMAWESTTNGASIASHGKWIQARLHFAAGSGRESTPSLISLSLNYSVEGDVTNPRIESVKADGSEIRSGDPVLARPTIEATITDNVKVNAADIKIDGSSIGYSFVSSSEVRWVIQASVSSALSDGSHTLVVEAQDDAGNETSVSYSINVSSKKEISGPVKAMSLPGSPEVIIAYKLTVPTSVRIKMWDFTGTLVKDKIFYPDPNRPYSGGNTGYNAVGINISDLPIGPYIVIVQPTGGAPASGKFSIKR